MKRWTALLLCCVFLLSGCGSKALQLEFQLPHDTLRLEFPLPQSPGLQEVPESVPPDETQQVTEPSTVESEAAKQVLMLYMVGSDLESRAGLASLDIDEILTSDICFENMAVYLCAGGSAYWWNDTVSNQGTEVFEVTAEGLQPVYIPKNQNMALPETLTEFIDYSYRAREAQYYSLVLWNHGGGAVLGFGADENYGYDALTLQEMDEAFKNTALTRDGKRFEWAGFDACLMGMIEVADMLEDYAEYMIASEEMESGSGWDYSCLGSISREAQPTGPVCAESIIGAYRKYHETYSGSEYTLSALELSKTDAAVQKLERLVEVAGETLLRGGYSKIARFRSQAKAFGKVSSEGIYDTVDLYDLSEKLMELYPQQTVALQAALEDLVICHTSNIHGAHGVAVYFPFENKENAAAWLQIYRQTDFSPAYVHFIQDFCVTLTGESLTQWNVSEDVPVENEDQPGTYQIQLTPEQVGNFGHASFSVWEEDAPGSYICWLISRDVTLHDNGYLSSCFQGKRFYVEDSSGHSLPCHASEIERNDAYVKYSIPVLVIPAESDAFFDMIPTNIHVRVDAAHPEGEILGYYQEMYTDDIPFPTRSLIQIQEGDIVAPFLYARQIVTREDGTLAPFDQWQSTSGLGADFMVKGDFTVAIKEAEPDVSFRYLFAVTDTQGNQYFTDTTAVTE